jgi:hypothetical protein
MDLLGAQRSVHRLPNFGNRGGRLVADLVGVDDRHPRHQDGLAVLAQRPTSALFEDLRIARMLRGTRPVQVFLTVRKRPEFFFQAEVLFAGLR